MAVTAPIINDLSPWAVGTFLAGTSMLLRSCFTSYISAQNTVWYTVSFDMPWEKGEVSREYSPDGSIMHPTGPNINHIHHRSHNPDGNTHLQIRFWINVLVFLCLCVRLFWGFWMQGQRVRGCCVSCSFPVSAYIKCHNSPDRIKKWWAVTSSPTWTAASSVQVLT